MIGKSLVGRIHIRVVQASAHDRRFQVVVPDNLRYTLKVEEGKYEMHYVFPPLAEPAESRGGGILCWPQLDVFVRRDSGVIQRIYLHEFCF